MKRILIVDDDKELRSTLSEILTDAGYHADEAASGREALNITSSTDIDMMILDMMMPGINGMEVLSDVKKIRPSIKVIMMTAFATVNNAVEAVKKGASDYLSKPFKIEDVLAVIGRVTEEVRFEAGIKKLDFEYSLKSLSNAIRRDIMKLLNVRKEMRLMEITRELEIDDHTKVVFHLKLLKEAGILEQNKDKLYVLTPEGKKMIELLKFLENYLSEK
jgi:DNA-binding NtrC family response regulator